MKKVALIGYGAIARTVMRILDFYPEQKPQVVGVMEHPSQTGAARELIGDAMPVVGTLPELLALGPDLVAECATQEVVAQHGPAVLEAGHDFLIISTGALADGELFERLRAAAITGGSQFMVPAGALAGVDALAAARLGGLAYVHQSIIKPPKAWRDTPAEEVVDLDELQEAVTLFEGSAREAAALYPKNANVAATVAAAGLGFEEGRVELIADPQLEGPMHRIEAKGAFGTLRMELAGVALPDNPKTSMLAALSMARALINTSAAVVV
jgi:aspartate dehydrogenase